MTRESHQFDLSILILYRVQISNFTAEYLWQMVTRSLGLALG